MGLLVLALSPGTLVYLRWTPHPVIVTIRDNKDLIRVLLYSSYITITGWAVIPLSGQFVDCAISVQGIYDHNPGNSLTLCIRRLPGPNLGLRLPATS